MKMDSIGIALRAWIIAMLIMTGVVFVGNFNGAQNRAAWHQACHNAGLAIVKDDGGKEFCIPAQAIRPRRVVYH